jgi:hypothetical protein
MPEDKDSVLKQLEKDFPSEEQLEKSEDVFGLNDSIVTSAKEEKEEGLPDELKNRHIRRLEAKLAREREASIELAAREAARSELEKFQEQTQGMSIDERVSSIFTKDDVGKRSAEIFQTLLNETKKQARDEALSELQNAQEASSREVKEYGDLIEENLEGIEDDFNVDLSGSTEQSRQTRNSFLTFVAKLSPKDDNGNIESYADFDSAWELYQERLTKANTRNKDLASRGTVRSSSANTEVKTEATQNEKWLRDQGII